MVKQNVLVKNIEKKYGVNLGYSSDAELHKSLRDSGLPSLSRLLKRTASAKQPN